MEADTNSEESQDSRLSHPADFIDVLDDVHEVETEAPTMSLHDVRHIHIESLERFFNETDDDYYFESLSIVDLETRVERLNHHFALFEEANVAYRRSSMMVTNNLFINMESRYMTAIGKVKARIVALLALEQPRPEQVRNGHFGNEHFRMSSTMIDADGRMPTVIRVETARLPQIGKFSGNPAEVHNKDMDPVTKLIYLQEACEGSAKAR